jgi:hypothetical protein
VQLARATPAQSVFLSPIPGDALRIDRRSVPPAWVDPVKFGSGHVAKGLDVILERLFRFVGQLRECIERNVTCDLEPDQGLNMSLLRSSDAGRYRSRGLSKRDLCRKLRRTPSSSATRFPFWLYVGWTQWTGPFGTLWTKQLEVGCVRRSSPTMATKSS